MIPETFTHQNQRDRREFLDMVVEETLEKADAYRNAAEEHTGIIRPDSTDYLQVLQRTGQDFDHGSGRLSINYQVKGNPDLTHTDVYVVGIMVDILPAMHDSLEGMFSGMAFGDEEANIERVIYKAGGDSLAKIASSLGFSQKDLKMMQESAKARHHPTMVPAEIYIKPSERY